MALRRLAGDAEHTARMGEAAARDAGERFGRGRMLEEIEAAYERVLGG